MITFVVMVIHAEYLNADDEAYQVHFISPSSPNNRFDSTPRAA